MCGRAFAISTHEAIVSVPDLGLPIISTSTLDSLIRASRLSPCIGISHLHPSLLLRPPVLPNGLRYLLRLRGQYWILRELLRLGLGILLAWDAAIAIDLHQPRGVIPSAQIVAAVYYMYNSTISCRNSRSILSG
jgi:hypothetical protein